MRTTLLIALLGFHTACKSTQANITKSDTDSDSSISAAPSGDARPTPQTIFAIVNSANEYQKYLKECEDDPSLREMEESNMKFDALHICQQKKQIESVCWKLYKDMEMTNGKQEAVWICEKQIADRVSLATAKIVLEELYIESSKFTDSHCRKPVRGERPPQQKEREQCLRDGKISHLCHALTDQIADNANREYKFKLCVLQTPFIHTFSVQ